ncbi:MAG: low temperature requirement protein A [Thermoproteota archaeon]|nr:low temperature requirement protein A [Thermoproteota archaeon]
MLPIFINYLNVLDHSLVLGISILAVVDGILSHKWTAQSITDAALGLGITFSLWWIYFDSVDGAEIKALRSEKRVGS